MTRHSLLRLAMCNLLFIGIIFAFYAKNNLNIRKSYAIAQNFPGQYFAPDVDATIAGNPFPTVIAQASKLAGTRYYELGFITTKVGQCQAAWDGVDSLNYMQGDIANLRASGGDIILNFGGYAASNPDDSTVDPQQQEELALACPTVASLRSQYQKAITAYQATRVAFDIEGDALADPKYAASVILRDQAIAGLKSGVPGTKLCVEFTLTGTTTGLTDKAEVLLKDAIDKGVNVCLVNILAMNYGSSAPVNQPGVMGQYAVDAAKEAFIQLKYLFSKNSDSQVWSMMGITIMNGVNNSSGEGGREIFALSDIPTVLQFAMRSGIRELSMWELHRDQPPANSVIAPTDTVTPTPMTSSGIQQKPYQFSAALNKFSASAQCPPGTVPGSVDVPTSGPGASATPAAGSSGLRQPRVTPSALRGNSALRMTIAKGNNGNQTTQITNSKTSNIGDANCISAPNSGSPNPIGISNQNCSATAAKGESVESLAEDGGRELIDKMSSVLSRKPKSEVSTVPTTTGGHLGLLIGKSGNQFQVGQQVTYQLTPCNISLTGTQIIVISDTISGGLTGLRVASNNWRLISNSTFSNGSVEVIAIYAGPLTTNSGGTLQPLIFSGHLTAAASPFVTSFGVVATLAGTSGSLAPSASSGPSGPIGVSLSANVTGWAAAVDTLSVLLPK